VGYGLYLLHGAAAVPVWVAPAALAVFVIVAGLLVLVPWLQARPGPRGRLFVPVLACVSLLLLPAAASASSVARGLGPFDTPFESLRISTRAQAGAATRAQFGRIVQGLELQQRGSRFLLGTDTSALAAPYILASGREVLPIGGYLGGAPAPTLATLRSDVSNGYVHLFMLPIRPASRDPRLRWIEANCTQVQASNPLRPVQFAFYHCG
jgi:hypothetical protein